MENFNIDLSYLCTKFNARKDHLKRFVIKHFNENKDYVLVHPNKDIPKNRGGHNKESIFITENTYNLVAQSYSISKRYIPSVQKHTIMSLENQTIGFIESCLRNVYSCTRQKRFGVYRCDLCIDDYKIIVECDEWGHKDRNEIKEEQRQKYIEDQGYTFLRFNPNDEHFDLSIVIRNILELITRKQ